MNANTTGTICLRSRKAARNSKAMPTTDMTPLVDLGFLLISFFVITTEMSRPAATDLFMPRLDGSSSTLAKSTALTFLLGAKGVVYYYHGDWKQAATDNEIRKLNIALKTEIRQMISEKQKYLDQYYHKGGRNALMFLIKPGASSQYGHLIDIIDEALIHDVKKYAVLPLQNEELEFLEKQGP